MNKVDLYEILGVQKTATKKEIRSAYLKAVKEKHPDVNKDISSEKFDEIKKAYETLYDDNKRSNYDSNPQSFDFHNNDKNFSYENFFDNQNFNFQFNSSNSFDFNQDLEKLFANLFSQEFNNINEEQNIFGSSEEMKNNEDIFHFSSFTDDEKIKELILDLNLTLKQAIEGFEKILVEYERQVICRLCNPFYVCYHCSGTKVLTEHKREFITYKSITLGKYIILKGKGNEFSYGLNIIRTDVKCRINLIDTQYSLPIVFRKDFNIKENIIYIDKEANIPTVVHYIKASLSEEISLPVKLKMLIFNKPIIISLSFLKGENIIDITDQIINESDYIFLFKLVLI